MSNIKLVSITMLYWLITATSSKAHPHVFIETTSTIVINDNHEITGVRHRWKFDDQYTAFALIGMDVDKDGRYSKSELEPLARENMSSLIQFSYFTYASQNSKNHLFKSPIDGALTYENKILVLEFSLKFERPIKVLANPLKLSVYDPEFYIAFMEPKRQPQVKLSNTAPKACVLEKRRPTMDQTTLVESRLGQPRDPSNEENKGAGSLFSPIFVISCLKKQ